MNGWRTHLLSILTSAVLTGAAAWFLWGNKAAALEATALSREDVTEMIRTTGPYIEDRAMVQELRSAVQGLTTQVQQHGQQLARFGALLERLEQQFDRRRSP